MIGRLSLVRLSFSLSLSHTQPTPSLPLPLPLTHSLLRPSSHSLPLSLSPSLPPAPPNHPSPSLTHTLRFFGFPIKSLPLLSLSSASPSLPPPSRSFQVASSLPLSPHLPPSPSLGLPAPSCPSHPPSAPRPLLPLPPSFGLHLQCAVPRPPGGCALGLRVEGSWFGVCRLGLRV